MSRSRRIARLARGILFALLPATLAHAQHDVAPGATPDVPPGAATVRGRVVHPERPEAAAGVEVVLYALPPSGVPGLRRVQAGPDGSFELSGISNDPEIPYLVGARYGSVPFPGERFSFERGQTERRVDVRIADATTDGSSVRVTDLRIELARTGRGVRVAETHRLHNAATRVISVPAAERERTTPGFRGELPEGATDLQHPLGMKPEGFVQRDREIAFFGPIYPGDQELSFSYELPLAAGAATIAKRLPGGAARVSVVAPPELGRLSIPGFSVGEAASVDGRTLPALQGSTLAPGSTLAIALELMAARNDPGALGVDEVRVQIELDEEALLFAHQRWTLRVQGDVPLIGTPEAPLLRIPLPDGAEELRFPPETQRLGLVASERGGLALTGPIPPGESTLELAYRAPLTGGPVDAALRFDHATPLLTVLIADSGLVPESTRLHRRRPVPTQDGPFLMHLEAFDVEAGETVPLRLVPLPGGERVPRSGVVLGLLVLSAAAVAFLVRPLARGEARERDEQDLSPARREREALYVALRDLDDDFETGKVSEEDHERMRGELRARAASLLEAEKRAEAARIAAVPAPPDAPAGEIGVPGPARFCAACGRAARTGDRFCAGCGTQLDAAAEAREPAGT